MPKGRKKGFHHSEATKELMRGKRKSKNKKDSEDVDDENPEEVIETKPIEVPAI